MSNCFLLSCILNSYYTVESLNSEITPHTLDSRIFCQLINPYPEELGFPTEVTVLKCAGVALIK